MNKILAILAISASFGINAQTVIFTENFDAGASTGFTVVDNDGLTPNAAVSEFTEAWIRLADPDNTSDTVMGSTSYFEPVGQADRWLITPAITVGGFGNIFYWEAKSHDASFPDDYLVLVSTTDNATASFTDTIGSVIEENADWTARSANLSNSGYNNQTIYIAFVNRTNDGFKLYVDDIRVEIEDPVGLEEATIQSLVIAPNPVTDWMTVQGEHIELLEVVSLSGNTLRSRKNTNSLYLGDLSSGSYLIRATRNGHTITERIIKR